LKQLQTLKSELLKTRIVQTKNSEIEEGDTIGYWQFFKTTEDLDNEWGCIPVWGFANVTQSKNSCIKKGERLFGYFPPADSLVINPIKISDQAFSDGKDHRKDLPAVYNNYVRVNGCICDALEEESYLNADQIIIVSASSKTAIGLAQGLKDSEQTPNIIGLTSSKNTDFVTKLGCYDKVISYDQLLHGSLGDNMLKCYTVGMTHWDNEVTAEDALGQAMLRERTEFFFAPAHIQKRFKDWGYEGYNQRTNQFMSKRSNQSKDWMNIIEIDGLEKFIETYNQIVVGNINPKEGIIVKI